MARPVDYDSLAGRYDERYRHYRYPGVEGSVIDFARGGARVLEVGCGTGQWVARLEREGHTVVGLDASAGMLAQARTRAGRVGLVQARAEALPFADASFDRVCCVHAFHHFRDRGAFLTEARRVLRPGGGLLVLGLDPHTGHERWWIYDYYPSSLASDRARFPSSAALRALLAEHGFGEIESREIQRMDEGGDAEAALAEGKLDKGVTSQLALLTDEEYRAGIEGVKRDIAAAKGRGEALRFETDLRLWATTGVATE